MLLDIRVLLAYVLIPRGNNSVVECQLPKLKVAGSNPVSRSNKNKGLDSVSSPFFFVNDRFASVFASVCI